ncbi:ATP-dependent RNA helicase DDX47/RRP3 [Nematocida sp. AWRm77]|nr:ATP-dependent RNA helicase DDX47/RRP3 [Nematocida sp. AWRm77]
MTAESKTFAAYGLEEALVDACTKLGMKDPTDIQAQILGALGRKKDLIAVSGTGTGKTLAYALPMLHHLLQDDKYFYGLVLLPTRELAQQVYGVFAEIGKEIGLRTSLLIGGVDLVQQGKSLANRPHVIVGTPGRVVYHLKNTKGIFLDSFRYLVLDECDKLLEGDFEGEVKEALSLVGKQRNTLLFTATLSRKVVSLKDAILKNPLFFETASSDSVPAGLVQNYIYLPQRYKEVYLYDILRKIGMSKCIVFVSTCISTEKLERLLSGLGESVCALHGSKTQAERTAIIEGFRVGQANVLLATEVAARGIDIADIKLIINYDLPEHYKEYIHRVGRTARAGSTGRAITFVTQYDVKEFQVMEHKLGVRMEEYKVDKSAIHSLIDTVTDMKKEADAEVKEQGIGKRIKEDKKKRKGTGTARPKRKTK